MLFLWFFHACRRASPRFLMVSDHVNYLTFEDPGAVNTVRRALKLAHAGDLHGAAETAGVDVGHAGVVSEALQRGMRFSIGAEMDNDPRSRPDAANIVEAMRPDGIVRSVNFVAIDHPEKGADWLWPITNPEFAAVHEIVGADDLWERYTAKLFDDLERLPANIAGHFYAPAAIGGWPSTKRLEGYEDRLLTICHARSLAVELNTRPLYREVPAEFRKRYLEATTRLIRKAKELGVGIAVGSSAHSPRDQGAGFDAALPVLDAAGVNELVFPVGGRLLRVALRATREHLEAQAKKQDVVQPGSSITGFSRAELGLPETPDAPATRREGARPARQTPAKKRTAGPARPAKRAEEAGTKGARSPKRSEASSTSSTRAKEARSTAKPPPRPAAKPAKPKPPAKPAAKPKAPAKAPKPAKPAKPVKPVKAAKPAKIAKPKAAPARKGAKPAVKTKAATAKTAAKRPAKKAATKSAAKRPAVKTTVRKAPAKAAVKKAAPKKPAPKKPAAKAVKPKKKPASKRR